MISRSTLIAAGGAGVGIVIAFIAELVPVEQRIIVRFLAATTVGVFLTYSAIDASSTTIATAQQNTVQSILKQIRDSDTLLEDCCEEVKFRIDSLTVEVLEALTHLRHEIRRYSRR